MTASILGIGTAVPPATLPQVQVRDLFAAQPGLDRVTRRIIGAAFDQSAIDTRHTVLPELREDQPAGGSPFIDAQTREILSPATGVRNDVYVREAPGLFAAAARDALRQARVEPGDVTHVVTASCTGFFAPGPDFRLVRDLGLPTTVSREHLGFLGCAAALPALRSAARICATDPSAVVLVACAELCTIHLKSSTNADQIVSSAVFADGAAAAVVSASPARGLPHLELDRFATAITEDGEAAMGWTIGDHGFEMTLTAEVPRVVGREVRAALEQVRGGATPEADLAEPPELWAVHPGGRSILDRVESACDLGPDALRHSRDVLREYGNMSSATILFILQRMLDDPDVSDGSPLTAVAFAPGLTVESARMTVRTGAPLHHPTESARAVPAGVR
jgi:alkylresorcinol/alkylpyrone synthase